MKIEGTRLGYAIYPYQFSFLDNFQVDDKNFAKLYIFELKDSQFVEINRTLFQKEFSLSMQNSDVVNKTLKKFLVNNQEYISDIKTLKKFFDKKEVKIK